MASTLVAMASTLDRKVESLQVLPLFVFLSPLDDISTPAGLKRFYGFTINVCGGFKYQQTHYECQATK